MERLQRGILRAVMMSKAWMRIAAALVATFLVASFLLIEAACSTTIELIDRTPEAGSSADSGEQSTQTIGSSGGVVRLGAASLTVPPGALSQPTTIRITVLSGSPPSGYTAYSSVYAFSPSGLTFTVPATIVLPEHGAPASSSVYWSTAEGGGYAPLATTLGQGTATAKVTHFSTGFVGSETLASEGGLEDAAPDVSLDVHVPSDSGSDTAPTVTVLAANQVVSNGIAVTSSNVYFTDPFWGKVVSVPVGGGALSTLVSGEDYPGPVATDGVDVYWSAGGGIMRVPLSGGLPVTVAASTGSATAIAIDATSVYWVNGDSPGDVRSAPLSGLPEGGSPVTIASGQSSPVAIAVAGTHVYWTNYIAAGTVMSATLSGGSLTTLASGQDYPEGIALDGTSVYWTNSAAGTVMRVPLAGGSPSTVASGQSQPWGIAVNGGYAYWTNYNGGAGGGTVVRAPVAGGVPPTVLASAQLGPAGIAVDGTNVYWTDIAPTTDAGGSVDKAPH
jgi:hypothetical protein